MSRLDRYQRSVTPRRPELARRRSFVEVAAPLNGGHRSRSARLPGGGTPLVVDNDT
jgi:hypothetical protein